MEPESYPDRGTIWDNWEITIDSIYSTSEKMVKKIGNPKSIFDDNTKSLFEYKLNSHGFRSNEFVENNKNPQILFAGCSETFGQGDTLENSWPEMFFKMFENHKSGYEVYNLSVPGHGFQLIINSVLQYIKKFGTPEYIFILFPDFQREIIWQYKDKNKKSFSPLGAEEDFKNGNWTLVHQRLIDKRKKDFSFFLAGTDIEIDPLNSFSFFYSCILFLDLLEELCMAKNIKLFWTTWDSLTDYVIRTLKLKNENLFKNYFNLLNYDEKDVLEIINTDPKKYNLKKEDGHKGSAIHYLWAKAFYDELISKDAII